MAVLGLGFALAAAAQWQWIGQDGRKVYSDRSPPADIAEKNILKRPAGNNNAPAPGTLDAAVSNSAAPAPSVKPVAPKISGKDAQLEASKKKAEDEEVAAKKVEADKVAVVRADNCQRIKRSMSTMESGVRVSTTNAQGEREVMDDKARATEVKRLQGMVSSECK